MRRALLVVLLVAGAAAPGRGAPERVPPPQRLLVLGPDGRPLRGALVLPARRGPEGYPQFDARDEAVARSDERGVAAGWPDPPDEDVRWVAWSPGRTAVLVPPGPGSAIVRLDRAQPTRGLVRLERGRAAARAELLALPEGAPGDLGHVVRADAEGRFSFEALCAGRWRLFLRHGPGRLRPLGTVVAGSEHVEPRARAVASLRGQLLDGDGTHGAAAARVGLRFTPLEGGDGGPAVEVVTASDGVFRADGIAPGIYAVTLLDPAWTFDQVPPRVEVEEGRARQLEAWFALRLRPVVGSVTDTDGKALAGARVALLPDPYGEEPPGGVGGPVPDALTDGEGRFRLAAVAPAEGYRLLVTAAGFAPWTSEPFRVDRGRPTALEPVRLLPGWRLEVRVRAAERGVVTDAQVTATAAAQPLALADARARASARTAETDAGGVARLVDLPADDVVCLVEAPGRLEARVRVPYPRASGFRKVDVDLASALGMTGAVLPQEGAPAGPFVVTARTRDGRSVQGTRTQVAGAFRFDALRDTATDFEVRAADAPGEVVLARIEGVMPGSQQHLEIPVAPLHAIGGTVTDLDPGRPAAVVAETPRYDMETERTTWTVVARAEVRAAAREGVFRLEGLPPGSYGVRAFQGAVDGGAVHVRVLASDVEGVELVMPSGARVVGRVLDADSLPVVGATVRLVRLHGDEDVAPGAGESPQRATNGRGEFIVEGLAPGLWRAEASAPSLAEDAEVLRLVEGEVRVLRDFVLGAGGVIEGRVEDADGRRLDGARIEIERFDQPSWSRVVRSDGDGRFRLARLQAGTFRVRAHLRDPDAGEAVEGLVEVQAGETARIDFAAVGEGRIAGQLLRGGRAVQGAVVDLVHDPVEADEAVRRYRTQTDADGAFLFEDLGPGDVRLRTQSGAWRTEAALTLAEGEELQLDLEAFDARLRGRVVTRAGEAVAGARVLARPLGADGLPAEDEGYVAEGRTGPAGAFELQGIPVGAYAVSVSADGLPAGALARAEADLPGADYPVEIVMGRGGDLALRTVDDQGRGVTGARVWVEDDRGVALHRREILTGAAGRVRIDELPAGDLRVRIHARGLGRPALARVAVREGQVAELTVRLLPAGALRLTVVGEAGDPVALVRVDVVRATTGEVLVSRRRLAPVRLASPWGTLPRTGIVQLEDLEAGDYLVRVQAGRRYAPLQVPVHVRAGEVVPVQLGLTAAPGPR